MLASTSATLTQFLETALDAIVVADFDGLIREFNPAAERMFGRSRQSVVHQLPIDVLVPAHLRAAHSAGFHRFVTSGKHTLSPVRRRTEAVRVDGSTFPIELTLSVVHPAPEDSRSSRHLVAHIRDLTADLEREAELVRAAAAQQEADSAMAQMRQRLDAVLASAPTILFAIDLEERFTLYTGAGLAAIGLEPGQIMGRTIAEVYGDRPDILPYLRRALAGESLSRVNEIRGRLFVTACQPVHDATGRVIGTVGVSNDVTEQIAAEHRLRELATYDPLTGLLNRRSGEGRIQSLLDAGTDFALLLVDLDHFKDINDSLGHTVGDQVLTSVADRLRSQLPKRAVLARLGGDELLVGLPLEVDSSQEEVAGQVAHDMLAALAEPIAVRASTDEADEVELSVTASIGIAHHPGDGRDLSTLLARADAAMFGVKRAGRSGFAEYVPQVDRARRRLSVSTRLRRALRDGRLEVHYQPLFRIVDRRPCAFEALARWTDPDLGSVNPLEFVGLAEETGLMAELTDFVITQAASAAAGWNAPRLAAGDTGPADLRAAPGAGVLPVSVNLGIGQLNDRSLPKRLADAVLAVGLPPSYVVLELVESSAIGDDSPGIDVLRELRDHGFHVVVDDFGVGYSSLARLRDLSAEKLVGGLKLDRSFVTDLPSERARTLLAAFVQAAGALDLPTIAEGIETEEQWEAVRDLGCSLGQGWLIAEAMPAAEVSAWLGAQQRHG